MRPVGEEIPDVLVLFGSNRADHVDRFTATIPRGENGRLGYVLLGENIITLHPVRHLFPCQSQGGCCQVDMFHEAFVADFADLYSWSTNDQGRADAFVVEKLLAPCMADPVIAEQDDDGVIENSLGFELIDDLTNELVGIGNCLSRYCAQSSRMTGSRG